MEVKLNFGEVQRIGVQAVSGPDGQGANAPIQGVPAFGVTGITKNVVATIQPAEDGSFVDVMGISTGQCSVTATGVNMSGAVFSSSFSVTVVTAVEVVPDAVSFRFTQLPIATPHRR